MTDPGRNFLRQKPQGIVPCLRLIGVVEAKHPQAAETAYFVVNALQFFRQR